MAGGPLPAPGLWLSLAAAAVLLSLAWRLELASAALVAPLVALLGGWPALQPLDSFAIGLLLLGLGFYSLIVGIGVNWSLRPGRTRTR